LAESSKIGAKFKFLAEIHIFGLKIEILGGKVENRAGKCTFRQKTLKICGKLPKK